MINLCRLVREAIRLTGNSIIEPGEFRLENEPTSSTAGESREGADRRGDHGWINTRHLGFLGRRSNPRRTKDGENSYVDWYEPRAAVFHDCHRVIELS